MTNKHYIDANDLLKDSFRLGMEIFKSGFRPDYIVGVWRGGTPVGIAVQEMMHVLGIGTDHISIRTSSYKGIGERGRRVRVHGTAYLIKRLNPEDSLLIVDDVFDTGLSIAAVLETIRGKCRRNTPEDIRIATPWFKPSSNQTDFEPDYFLHKTEDWLIFPHELDGLSREEIIENKPAVAGLFEEYDL